MFDIPAFSLPVDLPDLPGPRARIGLAVLAEESDMARELLDGWSHPEERAFAPVSRCARALLRAMLRQEVVDCRDRPILRDPGGRPVFEARAGEILPAISISHADGFVAAAHGFVPRLGLDIECSGKQRDIQGIAELAFGPAERRQVAQSGSDAFYRIWTGREALAKATSHALLQVTDRRDYFTAMSDGPTHVHVDGEVWTIAHARPWDDMCLAVAWQE